jgi:putative ABC transport system permease protein
MKFALRQLCKNPGFTALAMVTLALGIGVNTTTFSLVYAMLFRIPPYPHPDQIVMVYATSPQEPFQSQSPANLQDELKAFTLFSHAAVYNFVDSNLGRSGEPASRINGLEVGGDFFSILGIPPLMGRVLTPADDQPGKNQAVVVSERFWRNNLKANPDPIGMQLRLDAQPVTVVGVMPESSQDLLAWGQVEIWRGLAYKDWSDRRNAWLRVVARLKPGVGKTELQTQLTTIAARLAHDHPDVNAGFGLRAVTYKEEHGEGSVLISWVIMGLMVAVLLIACINLANLQLARAAGRTREYAVRIAVGASRLQLTSQLMVESLVLSLAGGALGLMVACWGNRLLGSRLQMGGDSAGFPLSLDYPVLGFTLLASVATGILFGVMPARFASRTDVNSSLKQSGRGSSGDRGRHRLRQTLVCVELALALVLLSGAAFFVRGLQRLQRVETNWRTSDLVTGHVVLPWNSYANNDQLRAGADRLEAALASLPGVDHAAVSLSIPIFSFAGLAPFEVEGQPPPDADKGPKVLTERITPDYFATLGISLVAGRNFTAADRAGSKPVVIISRSTAEKFWPKGDAIGHRIATLEDPTKPDWREIVGIAENVRFVRNLNPLGRLQSYRPLAQDPDHYLQFTLHSRVGAGPLLEASRRAVAGVDPDLAVYGLSTVDQIIVRSNSNMVLVGQLLSVAALLGLFLAIVGIYGVVAYLAAQRTHEIGIRMALGAQSAEVLWLVLRNGAKLALGGTAAGLILAAGLTFGLGRALPELPGKDPMLIAGMAALLILATLAACWLPARRATQIDPIRALRDD